MAVQEQNISKPNKAAERAFALENFFDYGIFSIIFVMAVAIPIVFTPFTVQGLAFTKYIVFYIESLLLAILWVTKGVLQGKLTIKRTFLDWPFLAILACFGLSAIFSVDRVASVIGAYGAPSASLASMVGYGVFFIIFFQSVNSFKKTWLLLAGILASGGIVAVISLLQIKNIFIFPWDFTRNNAFNLIGSLTHLAVFLACLVPPAAVMFAVSRQWWKKIPALLFVVLGLALLVILNITAAWMGLLASAAVILIFSLSKIIPVGKNNKGFWLPLGLFAVSVFFLLAGNIKIGNINLPPEVSLNNSASWQIAKETLAHNFILGSGPSTFSYNFAKYRPDAFNQNLFWNFRFEEPSNSVWEVVNNVGILGSVAVVVFMLIFISSLFLFLTSKKQIGDSVVLLASFSGVIGFLAASFFIPLNGGLMLVFVIMASLALASASIVKPESFSQITLSLKASPRYALSLAFLFLVVTAGVVMLIVSLVKIYMADAYVKQAMAISDPAAKVEKIGRAIELVDYRAIYYLSLAESYISAANAELAKETPDVNKVAQIVGASIQAGQKASNLSPNNSAVWETLASFYQNASVLAQDALGFSETSYKRAIELDPKSPSLRVGLASVYRQQASQKEKKEEQSPLLQKSEDEYKKAIELRPNLAASHYGLSVTYDLWNKPDQALDEAKNAAALLPSQSDYLFNVGRLYYNRGVSQISLDDEDDKTDGDESLDDKEDKKETVTVKETKSTKNASLRNEDLLAAESIFKDIIEQNNNYVSAHYNLALLYKKQGKTGDARKEFQKSLDLSSDKNIQEKIKKEMENL